MSFREQNLTDQSGKHFVITGANTGLGFETARALALQGATVTIACRDPQKAEDAIGKIRKLKPNADIGAVNLDLNDLDNVKAAADTLNAGPRIDVLINNAGLMVPPLQRTKEGFESQMGVNHLAHFALVGHLMPKILGDNTRVVALSSLAHLGGNIQFDDLHCNESDYNAMARYRDSKLANLLFALELERRLRKQDTEAISLACHPGIAMTELVRYSNPALKFVLFPLIPLMNTAAAGAWPTLLAATGENVKGGDYYGPSKRRETAGPAAPAHIANRAKDEAAAEKLWDISIEVTGVNPGI
ncbi:MAG: oxidoreductase [Alphaproteobacteria bacterium]